MKIFENKKVKIVSSDSYNYIFSKQDGTFCRWGETKEDDPQVAPAPELLDIELSTICNGQKHGNCRFCYKDNSPIGKNMSLETYKKLLEKFPKTVTQIAFGIGDIDGNPELFDIMQATRDAGIIPNITINGYRMTEEHYEKLISICGAVAVSNYDKNVCYSTVASLCRIQKEIELEGRPTTLKQVNIHQVLHDTTIDQCWQLLHDMQEDYRLKDLNAAVFLLLKPKGRASKLKPLRNASLYRDFISYALDNKLKIGFDSCMANSFIEAIKDRPEATKMMEMAEPCESTCFSYYIDTSGTGYPCSFCEGEEGIEGINVLEAEDFIKDVWNSPKTTQFRNKLLKNCRKCPVWDLEIIE